MNYTQWANVRIRTYELDSFGHVNNAVYLNYMEEARSEYLKQIGLSFHDFARLGVQIVIVESYVKYLYPARYGEEIAILGRVRDIRPVTLTFDYIFQNVVTGQRIAESWTRAAFINPTTGRPTRSPAEFDQAFRKFADSTIVDGGDNAT